MAIMLYFYCTFVVLTLKHDQSVIEIDF